MAKTSTYCPRCRQQIVAEIEQLFDLNQDPQAKDKLLSGAFNIANCPHCGYQGPISTPIIYHDPDNELLLTYFPPDLGLPVNEQERMVGPLIKKVVDALPNEKRKAYLFSPQTMLTIETMLEKVLEADGITKEMIEAQQNRLNLLQRLIESSVENRKTILEQEADKIDREIFTMIARLIEAAIGQGDKQSAVKLDEVYRLLLSDTEIGKDLKSKSDETQAAITAIQEAGEAGTLTRETLLDLVIESPTDTRLQTYVSIARNGMDYAFFQILSEKIDASADAGEKERLTRLREKLLAMTQEVDLLVQEQMKQTKELLNHILEHDNVEQAIIQHAQSINDFFIQALKEEMHNAQTNNDVARSDKLQLVLATIQKLSAPPPEYQFIEDLMAADSDEALDQVLSENGDKLTPDFLSLFSNIIMQSQEQNQPQEIIERLNMIYNKALQTSMKSKLN
jgi:hypothetical protein